MQRLEKEREELLCSINVAESRASQQQERDRAGNLRTMLGHRDEVEQQVATERRRVAQLDQEIRKWDHRMAEQSKQLSSAEKLHRQNAQVQRRIRTLENQLDRASSWFNTHLAKNSQLRKELEILRVERAHFELLYRRLGKELQEARKAIGAIINASSLAYDSRLGQASSVLWEGSGG
uniref:ODAD1 central coiled coil region domain-containing protein n=1 Tax=Sphenodon punctatus TaxID=8508 RepID=A0A8D0L6R9_SPHPU